VQGGVLQRLKEAVSEMISLDRKGGISKRSSIFSLGAVLKKLGTEADRTFYEDAFETPFFVQSLVLFLL